MQSDCKMTIALLQNKTGKQSDNTHFVFLFKLFDILLYYSKLPHIRAFSNFPHQTHLWWLFSSLG